MDKYFGIKLLNLSYSYFFKFRPELIFCLNPFICKEINCHKLWFSNPYIVVPLDRRHFTLWVLLAQITYVIESSQLQFLQNLSSFYVNELCIAKNSTFLILISLQPQFLLMWIEVQFKQLKPTCCPKVQKVVPRITTWPIN